MVMNNGTMLSMSSYRGELQRRRHGCRQKQSPYHLLRYSHCCPSLFTLFVLLASVLLASNSVVMTVEGASVTGAHHTNQDTIISSSTSAYTQTSSSSTAPSSFSGNHEKKTQQTANVDHHHRASIEMLVGTSSFVTKIGNGFERLVVSIDDTLALLSQSSVSTSTTTTTSTTTASSSAHRHQPQQQHECQTVLEQLKVRKIIKSCRIKTLMPTFVLSLSLLICSTKLGLFFIEYMQIKNMSGDLIF